MPRTYDYGEEKKGRSIRLTDTAYENLQAFAESVNLPLSELLERMGRRQIPLPDYKKFLNGG